MVATIPFAAAECDDAARRGALQAEVDIRNHVPRYYLYGEALPPEIEKRVGDTLLEQYGIAVERVEGCVVEGRDRRYWIGYNREISEHFSTGREQDLFRGVSGKLMAETGSRHE
jgi:hypothetical protein